MQMKMCLKCHTVKTVDCFDKNKRKSDGYDIYCKECKKRIAQLLENKARSQKYQAEYYQANRDKKIAYATEYQKENAEQHGKYTKRSGNKKKSYLDSVKSPCAKCGESRKWCIDFHHIDHKQKSFNINSTKWGWDKIESELGKVVCLCANCHREYHAFHGTNPKEPVTTLRDYLGKDPYELTVRPFKEGSNDACI